MHSLHFNPVNEPWDFSFLWIIKYQSTFTTFLQIYTCLSKRILLYKRNLFVSSFLFHVFIHCNTLLLNYSLIEVKKSLHLISCIKLWWKLSCLNLSSKRWYPDCRLLWNIPNELRDFHTRHSLLFHPVRATLADTQV